MFRTEEILKAAKMPPEAVHMSRLIDAVYFPILVVLLVGTYHMHFMLLAGDWDFWMDWKDRQWWPVVTPIVGITYCSAIMYYLWVNYRQPFGATLCVVCLLIGEWLTRYWGFYWWSHYPLNFVTPGTMLPGALMLDFTMYLTRNWLVTALVGGAFFGLLFYPGNWAIFGPTHLPIVVEGTLLSMADYMGHLYVRTGTPEYVRHIEQGSLRTFGGHTTVIAAFFASFVSMLMFAVWWYLGKVYCTAFFYVKGKRGRVVQRNDVTAFGEEGFAEGIK
ncbi:methane monooxygenase/ammonia monooxygenase subunit A [Betaproteobacteria bacterium PRO4]|nr:methane monooxygenase/ammonia monooxygenase subunit A [Betaproteobacteria bacterium PRO4]